jgi:predicted nucleotidyltransferase component of viral defense system
MIDKFKKLTLKALMSDEKLMYGLVLKGGNALQLVYEITDRASMDIDFSIEGDFSELDIQRIDSILDVLLNEQFQTENFVVFDVKINEKPKNSVVEIWKGYCIEFKITDSDKYFPTDMDKTRRLAHKILDQSTKFTVDISSFEYVTTKRKVEIDGTVLYVYTPDMIVLEKLRALCQSIPEYKDIIPTARIKGRARDYYDIWNICQHYEINFNSDENLALIEDIFKAKRVPLEFLSLLDTHKDLQRENWTSVEDTLSVKSKGFDFYFENTMDIVKLIRNQ